MLFLRRRLTQEPVLAYHGHAREIERERLDGDLVDLGLGRLGQHPIAVDVKLEDLVGDECVLDLGVGVVGGVPVLLLSFLRHEDDNATVASSTGTSDSLELEERSNVSLCRTRERTGRTMRMGDLLAS
jgi:hypothetical protein